MTRKDQKIRRALLSVSDKTGLVPFARELREHGVELVSTGGTARALREGGLEVEDVSDLTRFPEMLDGRVKTLHPSVHGGILALRDNSNHVAALKEHDIGFIDLVVINLYPFEQTVASAGVRLEEAIEQIDIGGPAMIRSAAKNFAWVAVVTSTQDYARVSAELRSKGGALSSATREALALLAFKRTARYDAAISEYLGTQIATPQGAETFPQDLELHFSKVRDLRYGENPHQSAALYRDQYSPGIASARMLAGKEMSFNNYLDAEAAWRLVCDLERPACAIIKHTNPAGAAVASSALQAYTSALSTDPVSAFGGIVAFNCAVEGDAARAIVQIFTEVVIAPDYNSDAIATFTSKKNLRVLRVAGQPLSALEYRSLSGGLLVQSRDDRRLTTSELKTVTDRGPTPEEVESLLFAWTVCKHTKSNAIVYARDRTTAGIGAGQMSRVDSVRIGAMRARVPLQGSVLASDAFFPFRDNIDEAARVGITAVIQPGGSVRDDEVIAAANEHGLAMVFTGIRHFRH